MEIHGSFLASERAGVAVAAAAADVAAEQCATIVVPAMAAHLASGGRAPGHTERAAPASMTTTRGLARTHHSGFGAVENLRMTKCFRVMIERVLTMGVVK